MDFIYFVPRTGGMVELKATVPRGTEYGKLAPDAEILSVMNSSSLFWLEVLLSPPVNVSTQLVRGFSWVYSKLSNNGEICVRLF